MSTVGANASDHGLIIQGTLILLSAIVGVLGYIIQSRLKRAAEARLHERASAQARFEQQLKRDDHLRAARLQHLYRIREEILSPMIALNDSGAFLWAQWVQHTLMAPPDYSRNAILVVKDEPNPAPSVLAAFGHVCPNFHVRFMKGDYYGQWMLVPDDVAAGMKANPTGRLAVSYRRTIRLMVSQYYAPLSAILTSKMNVLDLPDSDEFKRTYHCYASDLIWLRKHIFLQMVAWTAEMRDIISEEWDKGEVGQLHTRFSPYPMVFGRYLSGYLTRMKLEISELEMGLVAHNVFDDTKANNANEVADQFTKQMQKEQQQRRQQQQQQPQQEQASEKESNQNGGGGGGASGKSKRNKYIAAVGSAAAGAASAAAAVAAGT